MGLGQGDFAAKLTVQFVQHLWKSPDLLKSFFKSRLSKAKELSPRSTSPLC